METKELDIIAPEGYEINKENSTLERIVFKKKSNNRPRSWEEFCKRGFTGEEAYVAIDGPYKTLLNNKDTRDTSCVGYVDNLEEAKAFVALMQLRQLCKAWVDDWEPEWLSTDFKYVIDVHKNIICISMYCSHNGCLSFPTEDIADEFHKCFSDLLEQAKTLL